MCNVSPMLKLIVISFGLAALYSLFIYRRNVQVDQLIIQPESRLWFQSSQDQSQPFNGFQPIVDRDDVKLLALETGTELLEEIRSKWLKPPSTLPYNVTLVENDYEAIKRMHLKVHELFNKKKNGFFIESGGFDGVSLSNTLHLEMNFDWTGLIVEADSKYFERLANANRKSWIINACLALTPLPETMTMIRIKDQDALSQVDEISADTFRNRKQAEKFQSQCFPFMSILAATLGNKEPIVVDYLSLDIEEAEIHVIKTIPWDFVYIKVITIEVRKPVDEEITKFLALRNFEFFEYFAGSYVHDNLYVNKRFLREKENLKEAMI